MNQARSYATATLLESGKVLVAGGQANSADGTSWTTLASAELYNPATGTFAPAGSMTMPRSNHTATRLLDGRVLLAGGGTDGSNVTSSAEIYDPVAGTFRATGEMAVARSGDTATLLKDGRVFFQSHGINGDAELYNPDTGKFTATASTQYMYSTATLLDDGDVLLIGQTDSRGMLFAGVAYRPSTGKYSDTGDALAGGAYSTATRLKDGRVLIAGGHWCSGVLDGGCYSGDPEIYDPSTGKFHLTGDMAAPRYEHLATLLADGRVLFVGGRAAGVGYAATMSAAASWVPLPTPGQTSGLEGLPAEIYDPVSGRFSPAGAIAGEYAGGTATLLADGRVLLVGGGAYGSRSCSFRRRGAGHDPADHTTW